MGKEMIYVYTYLTPTHMSCYEIWFLRTLLRYLNTDNELLIVRERQQETENGIYNETNANKTYLDKTRLLLDLALSLPEDSIILSCDVDIQFFSTDIFDVIRTRLEYADIIGQDEGNGHICAGFWAFRVTRNSIWLLKQMCDTIMRDDIHDQKALNYHLELLRSPIESTFTVSTFHPSECYSIYHSIHQVWDGVKDFNIPYKIMVHHANWTVGLKNKIKLLEQVSIKQTQYKD